MLQRTFNQLHRIRVDKGIVEYVSQNLVAHPIKLLLDLVLFLAVSNIPFGVNGFMFAVGLSDLLWYADGTALGLSG
jgi:hypothetical protein